MMFKMMLLKKLCTIISYKCKQIGTSEFVLKAKHQATKTELQKSILNVTDFAKENKTYLIRKQNSRSY